MLESTNSPIRLWYFVYEYTADIFSLTATGNYHLVTRTPYEYMMYYTPDISRHLNFKWFQWSYYWNEFDKEKNFVDGLE